MKIIKAFILLLMISTLVYCQEQPFRELKQDDFQIEYSGTKISLRESIYKLSSERIGGIDPMDVKGNRYKLTDRGSLFVINEEIYPGLKIDYSYQSIERIELTDKRRGKTIRNITVGMSESDVTKAYGRAHSIVQGVAGSKQLIYRMKVDSEIITAYELIFEIANQTVKRIISQVDYDEKKVLTLEDFSVVSNSNNYKYHVMQSIEEVEKDFSEKPIVTKIVNDKGTSYESVVQQYQFGNGYFLTNPNGEDANEINRILVKGSGWATPRGIVVGDLKEKVLKTYGVYDDMTIIQLKGKETLNYVFTDFGLEKVYGREFYTSYQALLLDFTIENGKVKEIELSYLMIGED